MKVQMNEGVLTYMEADAVPEAQGSTNPTGPDGPQSRNSVVICQAVGQSIFTSSVSPAAGRVGVLLQKEEGKEASCPVLFIQLNELFSTPDGLQWKQTAR